MLKAANDSTPCGKIPTLVEGDRTDAAIIEAERRVIAYIEWVNNGNLSDPEADWHCAKVTALESFIEETPAYTPSGFAAKIRRLAHGIEAGPRIDDEGNIDARCLRVLADNLARMIGAN